jgi:amino acid adenylation domain-containing protein
MRSGGGPVLTGSQRSILFSEIFRPGTARFVESLAFRLVGEVDASAMGVALRALAARHDLLRSAYRFEDGRIEQVVGSGGLADFEVRRVSADRVDADLARLLGTPLELAAGQVFRALLLSLSDDEHVLALAVHHVVADDWSFDLLTRELAVLYGAACEGTVAELPPPEQLADYLEAAAAPEQAAAEVQELWQKKLAGMPAVTTLPADRSGPTPGSPAGGRVTFRVGDSIRRLARALRMTPQSIVTGAACVLVHKHTAQQDLVVGVPFSAREHPAADGILGCFVDLVPVRQNVSGSTAFGDLTRQIAHDLSTTILDCTLSSTDIANQAADRAEPGRPFCQLVVTVAERPAPLALPGIHTERLHPFNGAAKYDLFLQLVPDGAGYLGMLDYSSDLFDAQTVERFAERLVRLLDAAAADPHSTVAELEMLSGAERDLVTRTLPAGPVVSRTPRLVHEHFQEQAVRTPDAPAVAWNGRHLTYRELDRDADRLAAVLRAEGCSGAVVGIMLDRSFDMVTAVLAVLKAGAAYLPLDPAYPAQRLAYMLRDGGARVLLTEPDRLTLDVPDGVRVLSPRTETRDGAIPVAATATPGRLVYVIYTSGSTGEPKGIAMPHTVLDNLVNWQLSQSEHGAGATLQFSALSFDVCAQEMFTTWAAGGTLVLLDEQDRNDPRRLVETIADNRVQRLFLPYAGLQHLATYCAAAQRFPDTLREVITAGEPLHVTDAIRTLFQHCPASLTNQYGPAETHVVTAMPLSGAPQSWPASPSIGRPIDNARVYVLDDTLRPVAPGAVGELCIGGPVLADGYVNRPEVTAERFVRGPRTPESAGTLYRTGDLGRFLADGTIEFLGRRDHQIKIRGFRVEPGEIEHALKSVAGVTEAIVVAPRTSAGESRLAAYVTGATVETTETVETGGAAGLDPRALREHLTTQLPTHMVPATINIVERFPLTPSGKIDRGAVQRWTPEAVASASGRRPPRDDLEIVLCDLWAGVLGVSEVGVDDDFFDLGGSSYSMVQLSARIRAEAGYSIELTDLYQASTVARLAAVFRGGERRKHGTSLVRLRDGDADLPPVFMVHSLTGTLVRFVELKRAMNTGPEIYGLQARGLDPALEPHLDIVQMAGDYLTEIREVRPQGPYNLYGYSLGGIIAYEIAQQLLAEGADVQLLALGDTDSSWDFETTRGDVLTRLVTKALHLDLDIGRLSALSPDERVERILEAGLASGALPPDFGLAKLRRMLEMYETNAMAAANYKVLPYPGETLLIRARDESEAPDDLGWADRASQLTVERVPYDHYSMMERTGAPSVARILDGHLDNGAAVR